MIVAFVKQIDHFKNEIAENVISLKKQMKHI